jgi:hypothetical protein
MNTMMLRQWHGYFGVFIAPSVLFFALTGSLQLFSLHETHAGYQAAPILQRLGRLHKDQVITLPHQREAPAAKRAPSRERTAPAPANEQGPRPATLLLKVFFLLVAIQLVASTCLGLWIAFTRNRDRGLTWFLLLAGVLLPLSLVVA